MKRLKRFKTQSDYDISEKLFPQVSYIDDVNKVIFEGRRAMRAMVTYNNVAMASNPQKLLVTPHAEYFSSIKCGETELIDITNKSMKISGSTVYDPTNPSQYIQVFNLAKDAPISDVVIEFDTEEPLKLITEGFTLSDSETEYNVKNGNECPLYNDIFNSHKFTTPASTTQVTIEIDDVDFSIDKVENILLFMDSPEYGVLFMEYPLSSLFNSNLIISKGNKIIIKDWNVIGQPFFQMSSKIEIIIPKTIKKDERGNITSFIPYKQTFTRECYDFLLCKNDEFIYSGSKFINDGGNFIEYPSFTVYDNKKIVLTNSSLRNENPYLYILPCKGLKRADNSIELTTIESKINYKLNQKIGALTIDLPKTETIDFDFTYLYHSDFILDSFNKNNLLKVNKLENAYNISNMYSMFSECSNLSTVNYIDTSNATTMEQMFYGCEKLASVPRFDTINSDNMSGMFVSCKQLTEIPLFNTSRVDDMSGMFVNCIGLETVPQFDTHNVTNMSNMFEYCEYLLNVPMFDTSNVINMEYIFKDCSNLKTVPQFNTHNVTNMSNMFFTCKGLINVPLLDTNKVTNMSRMFAFCENLKEFSFSSTSNVTNMNGMFYNCRGLTKVNNIDTRNVNDMNQMFENCSSLSEITLCGGVQPNCICTNMFSGLPSNGKLHLSKGDNWELVLAQKSQYIPNWQLDE